VRAAVTGANGFLGSNLVRRLVETGWSVAALVRATSDRTFLDGLDGVEIVGAGLGDAAALVRTFRGADVVFHCAARASDWGPPAEFHESNVRTTERVVAAAADAGCGRLVHIGSTVVYGFGGHVDSDETAPHAPDPFPYCTTKLEGERRATAIARERGLPLAVVRPGNVFGRNDRVTTVHMYKFLLAGKYAHVAGGRPLTCPTYVENLVDAIVLAATAPGAVGEDFIVTDGLRISWREYVDRTCGALGVKPPWLSVPAAPVYGAAAAVEGLWRLARSATPPAITRYRIRQVRRDYHFSIAKARRLLEWAPRVGLDEALARTAAWYRETAGMRS
jgi:nucleoside-diphosphate-sugar epimerase